MVSKIFPSIWKFQPSYSRMRDATATPQKNHALPHHSMICYYVLFEKKQRNFVHVLLELKEMISCMINDADQQLKCCQDQ